MTLVLQFQETESNDETKYSTFYLSQRLKKQLLMRVDWYVFESSYRTIISNIQKRLGKGLVCIIDSIIDHNINISKYKPLSGSNAVKLPK